MNTLLIVGLFLGVASAYDDRCAWGESYWCSGIKEAKDCGAFGHCMTTVWPNQKLDADNTDVCNYCENIITDVRNFIGNKQSQAEIKQFLDSACSIIPIKQIADECTQTVDTFLPEVLDLITAELDPQVVCSLMGVCKGLEDTVKHRNVPHLRKLMLTPAVKLTTVPICADCKKFMQDIKSIADSPEGEKQLEDYLEQNLCPMLGSLADECKALIAIYVPQMMDMLAAEFDPAMICESLGFCNQTSTYIKTLLAKMTIQKTKFFKLAQQVSGAEECDLCKTIVGELQAMEKDNATQEEVENFIKTQVCSRLGALKGACDEAVDEYGPEIFMLLAQELDPNTFCNVIGLCSSQMSNKIPTMPQKPKKAESSNECILCEFVMKELDGMLADNATEAEIIAALDKVCSILPSDISAECTNFVNTYGPGILTLLEDELQPQLVCTTLGLCSSKTLRFVPKKSKELSSAETCGICETMIQYLDSILTDNATISDIEKALDKVCNFLPDAMKTQCDDIVKQYGPILVKLIPQFADPTEVCQEIGLCSKTVKSQVPLQNLSPSQPIVPVKSPLVGVDKCTYGPAYWCDSLENAQKCNAVAHCQRHVWNI